MKIEWSSGTKLLSGHSCGLFSNLATKGLLARYYGKKKYSISKSITMLGEKDKQESWVDKINQHTNCCIRPSTQIQHTEIQ
jgi:hypothetical protein